MIPFATAFADYWTDAWQRTVLTWDVLRERGNQYLEHERSGKPPLVVFDYEIVVDGRTLERPANYALARIKPPPTCPMTDPKKRPFVVIDPRTGHGPGIGGFKLDSEVGIALSTRRLKGPGRSPRPAACSPRTRRSAFAASSACSAYARKQ
jgi:hypothetical protein